jgi:hypothetical protein
MPTVGKESFATGVLTRYTHRLTAVAPPSTTGPEKPNMTPFKRVALTAALTAIAVPAASTSDGADTITFGAARSVDLRLRIPRG